MYKYILSFLIYITVISFYILNQYNDKLEAYQQKLTDSLNKSLLSAVNSFELLNDFYHNMCEADMAKIVKDANGATKSQRDKVRYELRKKFTSFYNDRKLKHLNSFQVFDKNGYSIIRFHNIEKYDDFIMAKRDSLKDISKTFMAKSGFEVGKYATTYRFQYPLFYDGEFVGSYEFGIDFNSIDKEMQKFFGLKNILILHRDVVDKVTKPEMIGKLYEKVKICDHPLYMLKADINKELLKKLYSIINKNHEFKHILKNNTSFSYKNEDFVAVLMPIKDINNKHIGSILSFVKDDFSSVLFKAFVEELLLAFLFGAFVLFFIYKQDKYKKYVRNIIDTQHNILLVTNGKTIKDVNKAFLNFFGIKNLNDFLEKSNCICDFFLEGDRFLQKDMDGINWIDYLIEHKNKKNIVSIKDKNGNGRFFSIHLEGLSTTSDFIVMLEDITEELKHKEELENKAYYDSLTNIYSRERFDFYLNKKLIEKTTFSIIMFDIDHFKSINDTYGHDVGDSVLIELTKLITSHIRSDDIFARWGGEEFMIIINTDVQKAEKFANKLKTIIESHNFKYIKHLTSSFGVTQLRSDDTKETLIKRVDGVLYVAKSSGRNCVATVS